VLREKKLENRNNLLFTFALLQLSRVATSQRVFVFDFMFSTPFTHPRKDPLEAVAQWILVFKES